jgi:hypothetical protein
MTRNLYRLKHVLHTSNDKEKGERKEKKNGKDRRRGGNKKKLKKKGVREGDVKGIK